MSTIARRREQGGDEELLIQIWVQRSRSREFRVAGGDTRNEKVFGRDRLSEEKFDLQCRSRMFCVMCACVAGVNKIRLKVTDASAAGSRGFEGQSRRAVTRGVVRVLQGTVCGVFHMGKKEKQNELCQKS